MKYCLNTKIIDNVVDWICITDRDYNIIKPTTATLVDGQLKFTCPVTGTIYYYSKITTQLVGEN